MGRRCCLPLVAGREDAGLAAPAEAGGLGRGAGAGRHDHAELSAVLTAGGNVTGGVESTRGFMVRTDQFSCHSPGPTNVARVPTSTCGLVRGNQGRSRLQVGGRAGVLPAVRGGGPSTTAAAGDSVVWPRDSLRQVDPLEGGDGGRGAGVGAPAVVDGLAVDGDAAQGVRAVHVERHLDLRVGVRSGRAVGSHGAGCIWWTRAYRE